ncbi:hypothetical protein ACIRPK_20720 [Kitasatospora sp. NPDC101801]|uniref:hypothetical protein n=1 Tax=Kitasatospora sp. NPDC101801 TaxID=3364103 RepID=UPI0038178C3B
MPDPLVQTVFALVPLLLIVMVERARALLHRPGPDVYEPGDQLSPAEAADIEAGLDLDTVYLPHTGEPTQPAEPSPAEAAAAIQAEADEAEAQLAQLHRDLDQHLARAGQPLPGSGPASWRAPHPVPARAFPGEETTA